MLISELLKALDRIAEFIDDLIFKSSSDLLEAANKLINHVLGVDVLGGIGGAVIGFKREVFKPITSLLASYLEPPKRFSA